MILAISKWKLAFQKSLFVYTVKEISFPKSNTVEKKNVNPYDKGN
jgi:hypothetical protein